MVSGGLAATDSLDAVVVVADKGVVVSRKDEVKIEDGDEIPQVINRIPGLALTDYGSYAGLKSVSLRGLGSANTAIYVDGVRVSNVQSGQADLGFLDMGTFSSMSVDYAQNSLSFSTSAPVFSAGKRFNAGAGLSFGSFGTWIPKARIEYKISDKVSARLTASWLTTDGDYEFTDYDGNKADRENNDMEQLRAGLDFYGNTGIGKWQAKAYYNDAERGTPGSITYLDADSRQNDRNGFAQFSLDRMNADFYEMNVSAKAAFDNLDYLYSYGTYEYRQKDLQLSSSHIFTITDWLKASLAEDVQWDGLDSTYGGEEYYEASRTSVQGAAALAFVFSRLSVNAAILYNGYFDSGNATEGADKTSRNVFSPSADFRLSLAKGLAVTGFARRAYRAPTFNDLYYPYMGNTSLKAEDSFLSDLGIEYSGTFAKDHHFKASVSGFHYALKNKITYAADPDDPTGYTWLPYNIGKVYNNGLDFLLELSRDAGEYSYGVTARYSYQHCVDKTPDSSTYGQQIAYVARNTYSITADAGWKGWKALLDYNLRAGRYDSYGKQDSWSTLDLSVRKSFSVGQVSLAAFVKAKNLLDEEYDVVRYYPMPGRSIIGGIEINF